LAGGGDGKVHRDGVFVQGGARGGEQVGSIRVGWRGGALPVERRLQIIDDLAFEGAGAASAGTAMQHEAGRSEAHGIEPALDDIESSHFLGDEEHFAPLREGGRDEVDDGLRFAGAGRALNDHAATVEDIEDRESLRAVGIDDLSQADAVELIVEWGRLDEAAGFRCEVQIAEQAAKDLVAEELVA